MSDCIFCKIISGDSPAKFLYEDDSLVVFPDIRPKADTHLLIVSKKHITSLAHAKPEDSTLLAHMLQLAPTIAKDMGINGFRTIINTGAEGGQEVPHIHFHLLAGKLPSF